MTFRDRLEEMVGTTLGVATELLGKNGELFPVPVARRAGDGTHLLIALEPPGEPDAVQFLAWIWPQLRTLAGVEGWVTVGVLHDARVEHHGAFVDAFVVNVDDREDAAAVVAFYDRAPDGALVVGEILRNSRDNMVFGSGRN